MCSGGGGLRAPNGAAAVGQSLPSRGANAAGERSDQRQQERPASGGAAVLPLELARRRQPAPHLVAPAGCLPAPHPAPAAWWPPWPRPCRPGAAGALPVAALLRGVPAPRCGRCMTPGTPRPAAAGAGCRSPAFSAQVGSRLAGGEACKALRVQKLRANGAGSAISMPQGLQVGPSARWACCAAARCAAAPPVVSAIPSPHVGPAPAQRSLWQTCRQARGAAALSRPLTAHRRGGSECRWRRCAVQPEGRLQHGRHHKLPWCGLGPSPRLFCWCSGRGRKGMNGRAAALPLPPQAAAAAAGWLAGPVPPLPPLALCQLAARGSWAARIALPCLPQGHADPSTQQAPAGDLHRAAPPSDANHTLVKSTGSLSACVQVPAALPALPVHAIASGSPPQRPLAPPSPLHRAHSTWPAPQPPKEASPRPLPARPAPPASPLAQPHHGRRSSPGGRRRLEEQAGPASQGPALQDRGPRCGWGPNPTPCARCQAPDRGRRGRGGGWAAPSAPPPPPAAACLAASPPARRPMPPLHTQDVTATKGNSFEDYFLKR